MSFQLKPEYQLESWQQEAIKAWLNCAPKQGPRHGIFDVFTGAGKTVLALESLHTRLIEALVEAEPFPDSLAALVNAWREEALELAPDVMSLADGALAGDIEHLLDTAHRIADPPGYYDQEDPPGWHEINGVASEIQIQLK